MIVTEGKKYIPHAEANIFEQDAYHMGTRMGKNVMILHPNHDSEICKYLIIVDITTGESKKVSFEKAEEVKP